MRITLSLLFGLILLLDTSCKEKEEATETIYRDTVITGNRPPTYNGVPTITIQNYINKVYIDLIGREPTQQELDTDLDALVGADLSADARKAFTAKLSNSFSYYKRFGETVRANMLNGIDSMDVIRQITIYTQQKQIAEQSGNTFFANLIEAEIQLLQLLRYADQDYSRSNITVNEFFTRILQNDFYDEINMGSENFVISVFENLYKRLPTTSEQDISISMVDGAAGILFLQNGASKGDFVNIATSSQEFYEGLIQEAYRTLLLREPTTEEMADLTLIFAQSGDYQDIQQRILIDEEYAGF